jgi:hypothetical protein
LDFDFVFQFGSGGRNLLIFLWIFLKKKMRKIFKNKKALIYKEIKFLLGFEPTVDKV